MQLRKASKEAPKEEYGKGTQVDGDSKGLWNHSKGDSRLYMRTVWVEEQIAWGTSELEALHGSLTLLEDVLLLAEIYLWGNTAVLVL